MAGGRSAVPLIYNPEAGGGRGRVRFREAAAMLALRNIDVEAVPTDHPGHATQLMASLAGEHPTVLVMGGDGTLSEACEGALSSGHRPTIGCIPAGTGNDFLRDHGLTKRADAIARIAEGRSRAIDAARLTCDVDGEPFTRHWINICGTGFAAQAGRSANQYFKWARGQAYNLGVLAELVGLRPTPTTVTLDGEEHHGAYPMVMVSNNRHTGGAMQIAPMAEVDDGLLDVLTVEDLGRAELMRLLTKVRSGGHVGHPKVHFRRAKKVRIVPERPSPLNVDGEIFGSTPVEIEVLPGALDLLL